MGRVVRVAERAAVEGVVSMKVRTRLGSVLIRSYGRGYGVIVVPGSRGISFGHVGEGCSGAAIRVADPRRT